MGINYYDRRHLYSDAELVECYLSHESQTKAAEEMGVSRETVARAVRRAGIRMTGRSNNGTAKITDEQILEAVKVMTRQQIADKYNIKVKSLGKRLRKLGVHALKDDEPTSGQLKAIEKLQEINKKRAIIKDTWHFTERGAKFIESHQPGFELVELKGRRYRLRCKTCGNIVERERTTIRKKSVRCDVCFDRMKEAEQKANAESAFINMLMRYAEKRTPKTCMCCGDVYYSEYPTSKWCPRCKRKHKGDYRKRAIKYGVDYEHGITLRKVCIRDMGICQICGKPIDWHDTSWNGYCGALYPSIDHKIALANGGTHSWDNVQLAHMICNSVKGASL